MLAKPCWGQLQAGEFAAGTSTCDHPRALGQALPNGRLDGYPEPRLRLARTQFQKAPLIVARASFRFAGTNKPPPGKRTRTTRGLLEPGLRMLELSAPGSEPIGRRKPLQTAAPLLKPWSTYYGSAARRATSTSNSATVFFCQSCWALQIESPGAISAELSGGEHQMERDRVCLSLTLSGRRAGAGNPLR